MNIFMAMVARDLEEVTRAIPVIDVGPAFRDEPVGLDAVAAQVRRASERIGFFYVAVGARIECAPSCVSAGTPARYAPAVYRDLVLEFYNANYFHRPGHAASAAAAAPA